MIRNFMSRAIGVSVAASMMLGIWSSSKALAFFPFPLPGNVGGVTVVDIPPVIPPVPPDPFPPTPPPVTPPPVTPPAVQNTPEPASVVLGLTGVALAGVAAIRRRIRRN